MRPGAAITRRSLLVGIGLSALAACAPAGDPLRRRETAQGNQPPANPPSEGGIGGTGIIGILADANRPLINGLRLSPPAGLPLRDAFGATSRSALALGQALTVEAIRDDEGALLVRAMTLVEPLVGPIEAVTGDGFRCLGVAVTIEPGAPLVAPDGAPFTPAAGQRVAVSGLWRGEAVVASRVELLPAAEGPAVVAGTVKAGATPDTVRIGALDLVLPSGRSAPPVGSFATATGRQAGKALIVERVAEGRFSAVAAFLDRLSVEGYLEPVAAAPSYTVSGLGHSFDPAAKLDDLSTGRALFVGPYDGTFRVELGLPLPEGIARRQALLAAIDDGFAPNGALRTR